VFRNASMTKAVTATAALQLIEREHMALDQPVDFRVVLTNDLGYFAGGRPE
jgi:hypothetical protein